MSVAELVVSFNLTSLFNALIAGECRSFISFALSWWRALNFWFYSCNLGGTDICKLQFACTNLIISFFVYHSPEIFKGQRGRILMKIIKD